VRVKATIGAGQIDRFAITSFAVAVTTVVLAGLSWSTAVSDTVADWMFWLYAALSLMAVALGAAGELRSRVARDRKGRLLAMAGFAIGAIIATPTLLMIGAAIVFRGD
jgi:hypothetical protein